MKDIAVTFVAPAEAARAARRSKLSNENPSRALVAKALADFALEAFVEAAELTKEPNAKGGKRKNPKHE